MSRAIELFRQAVAVYEQPASENPEESSYPVQLAKSLIHLAGWLSTFAQTKEARAAYVRALNILDAEYQRKRSSPEAHTAYLRTCSNLGDLLIFKAGAGRGNRTLPQSGRLPGRRSQNGGIQAVRRGAQAQVYATLGSALIMAGQAKEGRGWCSKALQTLKPLLSRATPPAEVHSQLSSFYDRIGRAHAHLSEWSKAEEAFRKAVEYDLQLVAAHPGVGDFQEGLGVTLNLLFTAQSELGTAPRSLRQLEEVGAGQGNPGATVSESSGLPGQSGAAWATWRSSPPTSSKHGGISAAPSRSPES